MTGQLNPLKSIRLGTLEMFSEATTALLPVYATFGVVIVVLILLLKLLGAKPDETRGGKAA